MNVSAGWYYEDRGICVACMPHSNLSGPCACILEDANCDISVPRCMRLGSNKDMVAYLVHHFLLLRVREEDLLLRYLRLRMLHSFQE